MIVGFEAGKKATKAIQNALWCLMKAHGWGTISRVERKLGLNRGRLYKMRARGMKQEEIMAVLAVLDESPAVFYASVLGGPVDVAARFLAQGARLLASLGLELPELASPEQPDILTASDLERLDTARFDVPSRAVEMAREVAFRAAAAGRRGDAAAAVSWLGASLRVAEQWHEAHAAVAWALNHAPLEGPIRADAWLRAAAIVSDYGECGDAAELASVAIVEFAESPHGDDGFARALVFRGLFLHRAGDHSTAIRCLGSALAKLPAEDRHNRFACHLSLGLCKVAIGDLDAAVAHEAAARKIGAPARWMTHLLWLRARIAAARGDFGQAVTLYQRTAAALEGSTGDAALVGAELARVHLQARRPRDAGVTAMGLAALAMSKRSNPIVGAAIRDLWCSADAGKLTVDMLNRVIGEIRSGLNQRAAVPVPRPAQD